jgi:4-amino-4-deoxy-L-arabinose transferase-like glycosyltransferase
MISTIRQPIVFDGTSTPVKTALFLIICAAWILTGLVGHDPWKPDEAITFGVIHAMLQDGNWMVPTIAGLPNYDYPPLYHWTAAALAWLLSPLLPLHDGARLATGLFMVITLFYTNRTAKRLFDERAGRISVLLLIGELGLLWRGHQMNPELAGLAGLAVALYGMTRIRSEPTKGGVTTGVGAGMIALSIGIVPALAPMLIALVTMGLLREWNNRAFRAGIGVAFLVSVPFLLLFPAMLLIQAVSPAAPWADSVFGVPFHDLATRRVLDNLHFIRILPWYGLPALPFAVWLWTKDRAKVAERFELALPLAAFLTLLVMISLTRKASDGMGLPLLLPLALAAAHTLDRLSRSIASFMDWFSLLFFGIVAIAGWFYWTAAVVGTPLAAAGAVARQVPGFRFSFDLVPFCIAVSFTLLWVYATARAHRNNRRAIVNWAAGATLVWVLANLLGLPAVDHRLSYRGTAMAIAGNMSAHPAGCIASQNLGDAQRASLDYFARLRFVSVNLPAAAECGWLLTQGTRTHAPPVTLQWQLVWQGARPADNDERLRLYRRQLVPASSPEIL